MSQATEPFSLLNIRKPLTGEALETRLPSAPGKTPERSVLSNLRDRDSTFVPPSVEAASSRLGTGDPATTRLEAASTISLVVQVDGTKVESRDSNKLPLASWEVFRTLNFPGESLNLNPGTLGTTALPVRLEMSRFLRNEYHAFPLGQYGRAREKLESLRIVASKMWPNAPRHLAFCGGSTQTMNLLTHGLYFAFTHEGSSSAAGGKTPIRVLSSEHEHMGGIGGFDSHPAFEVASLRGSEIWDLEAFVRRLERERPRILFLSQVTYTEGRLLPIDGMIRASRNLLPDLLIIIDAAQAVGLLEPPKDADLVIASAHKWMFGPQGTGFLWLSERAMKHLQALQWAGEPLDPQSPVSRFELSGGQDLSVYAGLLRCLELHLAVAPRNIRARSQRLASYFAKELSSVLQAHGIRFSMPNPRSDRDHTNSAPPEADLFGTLCVDFDNYDPYPLYAFLNEKGAHVKCIKKTLKSGRPLNILRFGFPFYETEARLDRALSLVDGFLSNSP